MASVFVLKEFNICTFPDVIVPDENCSLVMEENDAFPAISDPVEICIVEKVPTNNEVFEVPSIVPVEIVDIVTRFATMPLACTNIVLVAPVLKDPTIVDPLVIKETVERIFVLIDLKIADPVRSLDVETWIVERAFTTSGIVPEPMNVPV